MPVCVLLGVPESRPLAMLKLAHAGLFCTEKLSVLPLGPLAAGWNEYGVPARSLVAGVPEMLGAGEDEAEVPGSTCTVKGWSVALLQPSLTAMTMLE